MNSTEIENGINHIYASDSYIAKIIDISEPCNLRPGRDYYKAILRAIIGQQLSTLVAKKIYERFLLFFNSKPAPGLIMSADKNDLRNIGLSWAKINYVKDFSDKLLKREISLKGINSKTDEEVIEMLTSVKGIGTWTVQMLLVFSMCRLNVLPLGDFALRRAAKNIYGLRKIPDEKKLLKLSKLYGWAPYNSIASWYLWKSLEIKNI